MRYAPHKAISSKGWPCRNLRAVWGLAGILLVLTAALQYRILLMNSSPPVRPVIPETQPVDPANRVRFTPALGRRLSNLSCFDTPIGEKMGEIVPIAEASEEERRDMRWAWEQLVQPEYCPPEATKITWRKELWSQVPWEQPGRNQKVPDPPASDVCTARWMVSGTRIEVRGYEYPQGELSGVIITIDLSCDDRIPFTYPRLNEIGYPTGGTSVVEDIDKARLLRVLTTELRFPWKSIDDFVVLWSPSPTSAGHLRIVSANRQLLDTQKQWFDDVGLYIRGNDPQRLSIHAFVTRTSPDEE